MLHGIALNSSRILLPATLATLAGPAAHAQAPSPAGGGISLGTLLLVALVVGVLYLVLRRRRPPEDMAPPANPYSRDDAFGRPPYGPGPDPYAQGMDPTPPAQGGMGSSIARGAATGLAVGAGAMLAQEFGRRLSEHGPTPGAAAPDHAIPANGADHAANVHSPLAHDAGLDALDGPRVHGLGGDPGGQDFGLGDNPGWDDAGAGAGDGDWDA